MSAIGIFLLCGNTLLRAVPGVSLGCRMSARVVEHQDEDNWIG
jgi:hypothetical protein